MKVKAVISNRLKMDAKVLRNLGVLGLLEDKFTYNNPEFFKKRAIGVPIYNTPRKLRTWDLDSGKNKTVSFSRGSLNSIQEILLKLHDITIEIEDRRLELQPIEVSYCGWKLRDYQLGGAIAIKSKTQGLGVSAPGSGKTEIGMYAIAEIKQPTLILVHTTLMQKQWIERLNKSLKVDFKIGKLGGGGKTIQPITVAMVQTAINRIKDLAPKFGFVLADEVHHYAAKTFKKVIDELPAKYRIGLTGTLKRQDKKDFLLHDTFGEKIFEISTESLVDRGLIHGITIRIEPTEFYFDYFNEEKISSAIQDGSFFKVLNDPTITDEDELAVISYEELLDLRKRYEELMGLGDAGYIKYVDTVTKDIKRNELIIEKVINEIESGHVCLVLTLRRAHCKALTELLRERGYPCFAMLGSRRNDRVVTEHARKMLGKNVRCGVATMVAQESMDVLPLDRGFVTIPSAPNETLIEQQIGRLRRKCKTKKDAVLYYFWDLKIPKFKDHPKLLMNRYKNVVIKPF